MPRRAACPRSWSACGCGGGSPVHPSGFRGIGWKLGFSCEVREAEEPLADASMPRGMFPLGHLGLSLAAALVLARTVGHPSVSPRLVLVGAILPDVIDKPLALVGFGDGRSLAHTAVFALALVGFLAVLPRTEFLGLSFGVAMHLLLDGMWGQPDVLLWPALGLGFPAGEIRLSRFWETLLTDPVVFGGEVSGGLVLALYAFRPQLPWGLGLVPREAHGAAAPDPPKDDEP